MPLFSPIYTSTRPYSQTRSNTQWDLMLPDEILRLDRKKCIALFQGRKPALLYKLTPEELPDYGGLKFCRVIDYVPEWKRLEDQAASKEEAAEVEKPVPQQKAREDPPPEPNPAEDLDYNAEPSTQDSGDSLGMVELTVDGVCGEDDEDIPPGQ